MLSVAQYSEALKNITEGRKNILIKYYKNGPFEDANMIAATLGYRAFGAANLQVGVIGRYFSEFSGIASRDFYEHKGKSRLAFYHFMHGYDKNGWDLLPNLRKAIETLGWPSGISDDTYYSIPTEEIMVTRSMVTEGKIVRVSVNRYERDPKLRAIAEKIHGRICKGCSIDFKATYGKDIGNLVHYHHIRPLEVIRKQETKNVAKEIIPLCPNCHAVVHSTVKLMSVAVLQDRILKNKNRPAL